MKGVSCPDILVFPGLSLASVVIILCLVIKGVALHGVQSNLFSMSQEKLKGLTRVEDYDRRAPTHTPLMKQRIARYVGRRLKISEARVTTNYL